MNVGVEGNFPTLTKYTYKIKGKTYHMAETTIKDFVIGKTLVVESDLFKKVILYQIPSESEIVINASNSKPLDWYQAPVEE